MMTEQKSVPTRLNCRTDTDWLDLVLEAIRFTGYAIVDGVLPPSLVEETRKCMYVTQQKVHEHLGKERLARAGELGILRNMMYYDSLFFKFLEIPEALAVVDRTVSDTAILHVQNGFILPSFSREETPKLFQNKFHQDFPRVLNGYLASINVMFAIDGFTKENGGTLIVPGTQQKPTAPSPAYLDAFAIAAECEPGGMVVFDSTLYHAAGMNVSGQDRLAINHQFTRSYIKQQLDYVRALGDEKVLSTNSRTQQLLGWYTRVVTSLDEYYRPSAERLYRAGQG